LRSLFSRAPLAPGTFFPESFRTYCTFLCKCMSVRGLA
jgi:hypothetical protein